MVITYTKHISPDNATFEERRFDKVNFYFHGYKVYCTYKVLKMPHFEETLYTIAKPSGNGYYMY